MNVQTYRDRAAEALAELNNASVGHTITHATLRGALHASSYDDTLSLAGQAAKRISAINAALAKLEGNESAASFAEALSVRGEHEPAGLDDWLRETLANADGLAGRYL